MFIPEVENYLKILDTTNTFKGKRKNENFEDNYNTVLTELKDKAYNTISKLSNDILTLKNNQLVVFLKKLKTCVNEIMHVFKNDDKINLVVSKLVKLKTIAEFSVVMVVLDKIIDYSQKNKNLCLNKCVDFLKNNDKSSSNKKLKLDKIDLTKDYLQIHDSDSDSDSYESDSLDESEFVEKTNFSSDDFLNHMFKNNYSEPYNDIITFFNKLPNKEKNIVSMIY